MGGYRDCVADVDLRQFLDDDQVGDVIQTGTAKFIRPRGAHQAQFAHPLDGLPGKLAFEIVFPSDGSDLVFGKIPHHLANLVMLFCPIG